MFQAKIFPFVKYINKWNIFMIDQDYNLQNYQ